jgi:ABC-2 type transport system permease protein
MSDIVLFKVAVQDLLRPKKSVAALVLIALPALIALVWKTRAGAGFDQQIAYGVLVSGLVFGFALVILSVIFGTSVLAQEIEQKTITYLLTRPVPRWRILLSKFVAASIVVTITLWLSTLALAASVYGPGGLAGTSVGRDLVILPVGALAYGGAFLLLSTFVNRPLLWGLLYAFLWESWVPSLPGSFSKASLMAYLRVLAPHEQPAETMDLASLLSQFNPTVIEPALAWQVLLTVVVVSLGLALIIFSRGEYVPREDAD